jgi:pyruvate ferredoxin oxidoreductase alpha subunit
MLKDIKAVAIMDRSDTLSTMGGPLYVEIRSSLYELEKRPLLLNYIYGLGGRDVTLDHIKSVFEKLQEALKTGKIDEPINYLGVRE